MKLIICNKSKLFFALLGFIFILGQQANAQLNPLGSIYFENQYLGNSAMAGLTKGLTTNLSIRKQWSSIPGSPTIQSFTADYGFGNKVGIGINIYNDKIGLISTTRAKASYSYHLMLNDENQKIHLGMSAGFINRRLNNEDVRGDPDDFSLVNYDNHKTDIDADIGIAFTSNKLAIQLALPTLESYLKQDRLSTSTVDRSTFFSAISYKFEMITNDGSIEIEPKVCYRGVKGYANIMDAGANLSIIDNKLNFFGMYHSSKSSTFGFGMTYQSFTFMGMYTTTASKLSRYANSDFEVNLRMNLFK